MTQRYVLIIGSTPDLDQCMRIVAVETSVQISTVSSIADAKRLLIKQLPSLILCSVEVDRDTQAGVSFCQQLQDHPQLGSVPVILFSAKVNQDVVRNAAQSGARGFITLPTTVDMLRHRLGVFLAEPIERKAPVNIETSEQSVVASPVPARSAPSPATVVQAPLAAPLQARVPLSRPSASNALPNKEQTSATARDAVATRDERAQVAIDLSIPDGVDEDFRKKLEMAQAIVNKVLHNLRTSQLLQVVDLEDVPKVVSEITRSVCGAHLEGTKGKGK